MSEQGIPIYVGATIVGRVRGDTFYKRVHKGHYLRYPPAICFDVSTLEDAKAAGATKAEIRDMDSGKEYIAPIALILEKGIPVSRGHGKQIGLVMNMWKEKGAPEEPKVVVAVSRGVTVEIRQLF